MTSDLYRSKDQVKLSLIEILKNQESLEEKIESISRLHMRAELSGIKDEDILSDLTMHLSSMYLKVSNYLKAYELAYRSLTITKSLSHAFVKKSTLFRTLSEVSFKMADYQTAFDYGKKALDFAYKSGDDYTICIALSQAGSLYQNNGDYDVVVDYFNKALQYLTSTKIDTMKAIIYNNLAISYLKLNKLVQAEACIEKALMLDKDEPAYWFGMAHINDTLGDIYYKKGQVQQAIQAYKKVMDIALTYTNRQAEVESYLKLGLLYLNEGAVSAGEEALDNFFYLSKLYKCLINTDAYKMIADAYRAIDINKSDTYSLKAKEASIHERSKLKKWQLDSAETKKLIENIK